MIKKLVPQTLTIAGKKYEYPDTTALVGKINELVDAVNNLQEHEEKHLDLLTQLNEMRLQNTKKAEPTDPYVEQRKWIGKACWFWDEKEEEKVFGILTTIDSDCGLSDMCPYWNDTTKNWFEHCEPVKDDIIYKKEQQ